MRLLFYLLSLCACTLAVTEDECEHGIYVSVTKKCQCYGDWTGELCDQPKTCHNGVLKNKSCICNEGFKGTRCEDASSCDRGYYNSLSETCSCNLHWTGKRCDVIICDNNGIQLNKTVCQCTEPYLPPTCTDRTATVIDFVFGLIFLGCIVAAVICCCVGIKKGWCRCGRRQQGAVLVPPQGQVVYQPAQAYPVGYQPVVQQQYPPQTVAYQGAPPIPQPAVGTGYPVQQYPPQVAYQGAPPPTPQPAFAPGYQPDYPVQQYEYAPQQQPSAPPPPSYDTAMDMKHPL